ncbi:hypothetical protein BH09BAC1_BH09BAC1_12620 [soil metagenome]
MSKSTYQVVWSQVAKERIADIYLWHCLDYGEKRANKIVSSIEDAAQEIARFPLSAPIFEELSEADEPVRVKLVKSTYKIIYWIDGNTVFIVDIFHAAQDMFGEDTKRPNNDIQ